jgi:hypothetical protein
MLDLVLFQDTLPPRYNLMESHAIIFTYDC